jgi:hypothetical protein
MCHVRAVSAHGANWFTDRLLGHIFTACICITVKDTALEECTANYGSSCGSMLNFGTSSTAMSLRAAPEQDAAKVSTDNILGKPPGPVPSTRTMICVRCWARGLWTVRLATSKGKFRGTSSKSIAKAVGLLSGRRMCGTRWPS